MVFVIRKSEGFWWSEMKKTIGMVMALALVVALTGCAKINQGVGANGDTPSTLDLSETYPGYYATVREGIISIMNYNPDDINSIPAYQELIEYGDGAGLENEGVVYYIYVLDTADSTQGNEKYYYAELAGDTMEVLMEQNSYFASEDESNALVTRLLEMINDVREDYYG